MLTPDEILHTLALPFEFRRRPIALPADVRASWKVVLLLLMLERCCRGNRSSLTRLHVLNWAARSKENGETLLAALAGTIPPTKALVRLDPTLNRAVDLARGYDLVATPKGNRVVLTARGIEAVSILTDADVLEQEQTVLASIGHQLSEKKTQDLLRWYAQ